MRRIQIAIVAATFGAFVLTLGTAFAQSPVPVGFPDQTSLYGDAVLLARVIPLIIALGIGFGVWQGKASLRQPKSTPGSATVIRHDFGTVVAHWINGIGFIVALVSGMIVLRRLPRPDEMRIVFDIHYVGVAMVIFGVSSHLTQNAVTGGMGLLPRSLRDVRDGLSEMVEYTGVYGSSGAVFGIKLPKAIRSTFAETFAAFGLRPVKKMGKFLPVERVFSYTPWAIIVTVIVVTGLIKSFRYLYPIPPTFIATVTTIHDIFAYVSIVMLAVHLAAILLVPRHWTLLVSMLTTRISRKYVQQFHPLWEQELVAREQATPTIAPKPAPQVASNPLKEPEA